tara:strand:- start:874 stop:1113 length:240 start_codon:yes stop_codon:yes gene_type:complete
MKDRKNRAIQIRLPLELDKKLEEFVKNSGCSKNEYIRNAINSKLTQDKKAFERDGILSLNNKVQTQFSGKILTFTQGNT